MMRRTRVSSKFCAHLPQTGAEKTQTPPPSVSEVAVVLLLADYAQRRVSQGLPASCVREAARIPFIL